MLSDQDKNILKKILNNDQRAIYFFYKKYKKPLLAYISRQINHESAEEVMQDSFVAFFEGLRNFRGQSSLKTYLFSIARYKTIDNIRKKKIKKILFSALPSHFVESIAYVLFDDEIDKKIIKSKIEETLKILPNDYVTILRLRYWEGYKVRYIAERLKLSFKAAESLLFRARQAFIKDYIKQ